jgi:dolichyl-phosphate-mannose-protein mannosyltransferase
VKNIFKILILAFVFRLVLSFATWHPDLNNHVDWGIRFFQYVASKFYAPETNVWSYTWPNQPPGTIYMFAGIRKLYEGTFGLFSFLHFKVGVFPGSILLFFEKTLYPALLKLPGILADLGIGYLIYKITKKKWIAVLWLFNPVIWYNSALWGQYDSVINFLAILSFYLLLKRKLSYAVLAFALSLYIKASLLIFLPIFAIVAIRQKYKLSKYLLSLFISMLVIVLLSLPFARGNVFVWLYNLYQNKIFVQQLHIITANAFNIWATVAGIHERPEILMLGPLSYKMWGMILFTFAYIPCLWLVIKKQDTKTIFVSLAATAFSSFMLLTNMHERYLFPLFAPLTILVGLNVVSLTPYIAISLINLLNLYNFWWFPKIDVLVNFLSFGNRLMPRILGFINFSLFIYVYWGLLLKPRKTISPLGSLISKTSVKL